MKKILLFFVALVAICFAAIQFIALPKAQKDIKNYFASIGFRHVEVNDVTLSLDGLTIENITLDKDRFNIASNTKAHIFWPSYIFNSEIKSIDIERLKISSVLSSPKDILAYKRFLNIGTINNIATQNIKIKNIIWDIATAKHALRLKATLSLKQEEDGKKIEAKLNAAQHELAFTSQWSGTIQGDENFNIEGVFDTLNINTNILNLHRGTGWLTLNKKSKTEDLAAQFDAGSGKLLNVPVKNISLVTNQDGNSFPVSLRASAAAVKDINLYGDMTLSPDIEKQAFEFLLDMKAPNQFVTYLAQQNLLRNKSHAQETAKEETKIYLTYEPKNRFADGPFPFALNVKQSDQNTLKGTFLIYPNNLDVRGTAQGEQSAISLLQTLFSIDKEYISDDSIRFDENLKSLF